jgi:peptide-methionine (S)-S-oxide reductase
MWEPSTARESTPPPPDSVAKPRHRVTRNQRRGQGGRHITTEILEAPEFYFAEDYHQQYLAKNPGGYCSMRGTGVSCPAFYRGGSLGLSRPGAREARQ